jgi:DNA-directed RNA polymerase I, II, and III subunit RPABC5
MIVPIRCFTCGRPIDNTKWNQYLELISPENRQTTLSLETDIRPLGHKNELEEKDVTPEYVALNYLGVRKMCCRRMYLGTIDIFEKL